MLLTLFCGVCSFVLASAAAKAGVEGDIKLMRLMAEETQVNMECIETWRGTATYREYLGFDDFEKCRERILISIEFAKDTSLSSMMWKTSVDEWQQVGRDGQVMIIEPRYTNGLVKDGLLYRFGPIMPSKQRPYQCRLLAYTPFKTVALPHDWFDPFDWFHPYKNYQAEHYKYLEKWRSQPCDIVIRRQGHLIIEESRLGDTVNRLTYDASKGYNLVELYADDPSTGPSWQTYEYDNSEGLWLPSRIIWKSTRQASEQDGRRIPFYRELHFTKQTINQPIPPEVFTLEFIGMQPGDVIFDTRVESRYVYRPNRDAPMPQEAMTQPVVGLGEMPLEIARAEPVEAEDSEPTDISLPVHNVEELSGRSYSLYIGVILLFASSLALILYRFGLKRPGKQ